MEVFLIKFTVMKITILFFGITTDLLNLNSIEFTTKTKNTIGNLKTELQEKYPQLTSINSYAIAVNETYATNGVVLKEGDIVAIIPHVSGG